MSISKSVSLFIQNSAWFKEVSQNQCYTQVDITSADLNENRYLGRLQTTTSVDAIDQIRIVEARKKTLARDLETVIQRVGRPPLAMKATKKYPDAYASLSQCISWSVYPTSMLISITSLKMKIIHKNQLEETFSLVDVNRIKTLEDLQSTLALNQDYRKISLYVSGELIGKEQLISSELLPKKTASMTQEEINNLRAERTTIIQNHFLTFFKKRRKKNKEIVVRFVAHKKTDALYGQCTIRPALDGAPQLEKMRCFSLSYVKKFDEPSA